MPVPPRGPGAQRRFVVRYDKEPLVSATLAPAPIVVVPITALLVLGQGAIAKGYGGATYAGATYAGTSGSFAPAVSVPRLVTPSVRTLSLATFAPVVATPRVVAPPVRALALATFAPLVTATRNVTVSPATASLVLATFAPVVTGDPPVTLPLAIDHPYRQRVPVHQPVPPPRIHIPVHIDLRPTVRKIRIPEPARSLPQPVAEGTADNHEALVALYASGALSDSEYAALIAA